MVLWKYLLTEIHVESKEKRKRKNLPGEEVEHETYCRLLVRGINLWYRFLIHLQLCEVDALGECIRCILFWQRGSALHFFFTCIWRHLLHNGILTNSKLVCTKKFK